jgi:carbonic anhydrase
MGLEEHLRHAEADLALAQCAVIIAVGSAAVAFQPLLTEVAASINSTQTLLATIRRVEPIHAELSDSR